MQALSKISDIISQLKKKKEEDEEDVDISDLEIIFMKILNVLKTGLEEDKQRFATERMFQEEKDYEDQKRHEEFLSVLKQFVSLQPMEKPEEDKKTSGILDFFKNLIETLKNFFKTFLLPKLLKIFGVLKNVFMKTIENVGKLIKKIGSWIGAVRDFVKKLPWGNIFKSIGRVLLNLARFAGPIGLIITAIVGLSYLLDTLVKKMPDLSLLGNYKEAESVLTNGRQRDIEYFANKIPKEYLSRLPTSPDITAKEKLQFFVQQAKSDTIKNLRQKKALGTITPEEQKELNELELNPNAPIVTETQLPNVPPRPVESGSGARSIEWDRKFGATHNRDGTPKARAPAQQAQQAQQTAIPVRTDTSATELNRKQEEISRISQVLTERVKELQESKKTLNESVYRERDQKKRLEIINQTKIVNEELTLREKQLRDLQRGIIPQDLPRSRTSVLPQTSTPQDIVSRPISMGERAQPMPLMPMPAEMTQPTAASTATPMAPAGQEQSVPSATPMAPSPPVYLPQPEMSEPQSAAPVQEPNRVTNLFNTVNQENRMLELARTMSTNQMSASGSVVNNVGRTEVIPDIPQSVEASQRDDTYTLGVVLSRYKKTYV